MKKYELLLDKSIEFMGRKLFRIKALVDIESKFVKVGDEGGYIEAEKNLDQSGDAWVSGNARVSGKYRIMTISNMGTAQRTTTFFACKDGKIQVVCGCFFGDLDEFREQVRRTRGGTKHEKAYLAAADLAESVLDTTIPEE